MASTRQSLISRAGLAVGVIALAATSSWAQTPAATPPGGAARWQAEIYFGPLFSSRSGAGASLQAPEPEVFTAINGRPSAYVPSWYYGYGALLLGAVNTALHVDPGVTPLDDALRRPMMQRTHGWHVGARLMRTLSPRWSLEIAAGYATNGAELVDDARQSVEATRESFTAAWQSFLRAGGHDIESISSVASFEPGSLQQMLFTGSLLLQLRTEGRFRPYLTGGGGVVSMFGDLPSAVLTGRYQFLIDGVAPADETDIVVMRFDLQRHAPVVVFGTGVTYEPGSSWGLRADLRAHATGNSVRNLVDATPVIARPAGSAARSVTAPDTYLTVQHSTVDGALSSLSAAATGVEMFRGRGNVAAIGLTAGIFWRF